MKIRDRFEQWKTDNNLDNADVTILAVGSTVFASIVALAAYAVIDETKRAKENQAWIADEIAEGRQVYQLHDGSLISTEAATLRW